MGFLDAILDPGADDRRRGRQAIDSLIVPGLGDVTVRPDDYQLEGLYDPEQLGVVDLGETAFSGITEDPRLRGSQLGALDEFDTIAREGGLDARARARTQDALEAQRTESQGSQGAILANLRARGIGGSGLETMQRLLADQAAATRGARAATDIAADAEGRKMAALQQAASLAGGIRDQDYARSANDAQARDAVARFNAGNRQDVAQYNTSQRNAAQMQNLGARQGVSDRNVAARNRAQEINADRPMELFGLQRGVALDRQRGQELESLAKEERNKTIEAGVMSLAPYLVSAFSDEDLKEDVEPIDSREVLGPIEGVEFDYRDPSMGAGRQMGVMAQDLEQTDEFGDQVLDTDEGKLVDFGGPMPAKILGLLADINRRLEQMEGAR